MKVLVADDSLTMRRIITNVLKGILGDDFHEVDIMVEAKKKEDAIEKIFNTYQSL